MGRIVCIVLFTVFAVPANGQNVEFVAGFEGGESLGYVFAMPVVSVGLSPHFALVGRASASYLFYSFPEAEGPVEVRSPGVLAGAGIRYAGSGFTFSLGSAYETRSTTRNTPAGTADTLEQGVLIQGDAFLMPRPWTIAFFGSHGFANGYTWSRLAVSRQMINQDYSGPVSLGFGGEVTAQGNPDTSSLGVGGVLEFGLPRLRGSLQVRSGYSHFTTAGSSGGRIYVGAGVYRAF